MTALTQSLSSIWSLRGRIDWLLVVLASAPLLVAVLRPDDLVEYLTIAGSALANTAIYIGIAVGLLAYLKATGAEALVAKAFQGDPTRMIFLGALVGGLSPFCSCEVIPFVAGLLALGAPLPAVMAFWLSSPLMDPVQFTITAGVLGWEYSIAKTIAAVSIGLLGGFVIRALMANGAFASPLKNQPKKRCGCGPSPFSGTPVWAFWREEQRVAEFRDTAVTQSVFLLRWLALAYLIEAAMILYVPAESLGAYVGGEGFWPIVASAFVGMPAYLNGYAAPAIVSTLIEQGGMQPGAGIAFILAGGISSIPAMAAVYTLVKREVFGVYMLLGVSGAIISGVIFQAVVG